MLFPSYKKAAKVRPSFAEKVQINLDNLTQIEKANLSSIDQAADTFALIVQATSDVEGQAGNEALNQLLYHIGRWLYIIDAWDDLDEDREKKSYNPILQRYADDLETARIDIKETLNSSLGIVNEAYGWLDSGSWHTVLNNVITLGLPAVQDSVLTGQWKKERNRIIRRFGNE